MKKNTKHEQLAMTLQSEL